MKFSEAIDVVRKRVNIVDIISQYVRIERRGSNYIGLCPFHSEKTPSFVVSEGKQMYKCFGCGKGGNVYTFLQEYENMSFAEALKFLAEKVNVSIEDEYNKGSEDFLNKRKVFYNLYKDVANTYYKILFSDEGKEGLSYLIKRKLTKETIKKFGLGYAPKGFGQVYKLMKEKGYDDKILIESKLFNVNENGPYDFFYDRVMFPLIDIRNNVISFQGRILGDGDSKYINTAESLIYKKSRNLFAMNFAKKSLKKEIILCEGNMDVITLHQAGFDNAVASWGTAFTIEQANLIKNKTNKVILCQDTDIAGVKAIKASSIILEKASIETYVVDLKPVKDVDEFINKYGADEFNKKLLSPIPTFLFVIGNLKNEYNLNNAYEYEKYINSIVESLSSIKNAFVRDKYIKDVASQENLPYTELLKQVDNKLKFVRDDKEPIKVIENKNEKLKVESAFVSFIFEDVSLREKIGNFLNVEELKDDKCRYIYDKYLKGYDLNQVIDGLNDKDKEFSDGIKEVLLNKDVMSNENVDIIPILNELIKKIKINNLTDEEKDFDKIIENNKLINEIKSKKYF